MLCDKGCVVVVGRAMLGGGEEINFMSKMCSF